MLKNNEELGIYEMYAENRKKFDALRRQLLVFEQKEKTRLQNQYTPSLKEIIESISKK